MQAKDYTGVIAEFVNVVNNVTDWNAQTPCDEWNTREVFDHAFAWFPQVAGITVEGEEPTERAKNFQAALTKVLGDAAELDRTIDGVGAPFDGQSVREVIEGFLIFDHVAHAWDITRSQGQPNPTFDESLIEEGVKIYSTGGEERAKSPMFAAPVAVAEDAPALDRLIAELGRDPKWGES